MNIMPQRIEFMLDAILMTFVSFYIAFSGVSFASVIGYVTAIIALLFWINRLKMQIERYHEGSVKKWLKYFVKNWKL